MKRRNFIKNIGLTSLVIPFIPSLLIEHDQWTNVGKGAATVNTDQFIQGHAGYWRVSSDACNVIREGGWIDDGEFEMKYYG